MDKPQNSAIFLLTGLVTAAGANPKHLSLQGARSLAEEEQYVAAVYTAEQIMRHYPDTKYAQSARELIAIIKKDYLQDRTALS